MLCDYVPSAYHSVEKNIKFRRDLYYYYTTETGEFELRYT